MIKQLREFHTEELLAQIYAKPHDHRIYGRGHHVRVEVTKNIVRDAIAIMDAKSIADLSCGNGDIVKTMGMQNVFLGDYAPTYPLVGPIDKTIASIPTVDVYVCSESLEHVEDPLQTLKLIRDKSKYLVLSTPIENWEDNNTEHYWSWDRHGVEDLFSESGWIPNIFLYLDTTVFGEPYKYGIWGCK
ncbi:MAG: hypothetical protein ACO3EE_10040 [Flavobacteriales bacterium]